MALRVPQMNKPESPPASPEPTEPTTAPEAPKQVRAVTEDSDTFLEEAAADAPASEDFSLDPPEGDLDAKPEETPVEEPTDAEPQEAEPVPVVETPVQPEATEQPKAVPEQPQPEPAPKPEAAVQPEAATQEPVPTPIAEPPQPVAVETPEELNARIAETRQKLETALSEQHFKVDGELAELLEVDPAAAVSRVASKVYLDAVTNVYQQVMNQIPQLVQQGIQYREQTSNVVNRFFESWPQLSKANPQHLEVINRVAQVYRGMNPQATTDQYIKDVGLHAMTQLGIPLQEAVQNNSAPSAAPAQPQAFQPAGAGAPSGGGDPQPVSENPFEIMNSQLLAEDGV